MPARFLFVGGTAILLQFGLLSLFVETALLIPIFASVLSYAVSAVYIYLAIVPRKAHVEAFPKFLLLTGVGVTINALVFAAAFRSADNYLIAQVVAVLATLLFNYAFRRYWMYGN